MPEDQSGAGDLLNAEQVELLAQQSMVAFGRFFKASEVCVQILLRKKGGAVDALQLRVLLVSQPISSGQREHFEGLHAACRRHVRTAAEVYELAIAIEAHFGARLGEFGHEVRLHEVAVAFEFGQRLLPRLVYPDKRLVARHHFLHLRFNRG